MVFQGAGVKWCQSVCNVLIVEGTSGLQSRLRRFDSDPSLQKTHAAVAARHHRFLWAATLCRASDLNHDLGN